MTRHLRELSADFALNAARLARVLEKYGEPAMADVAVAQLALAVTLVGSVRRAPIAAGAGVNQRITIDAGVLSHRVLDLVLAGVETSVEVADELGVSMRRASAHLAALAYRGVIVRLEKKFYRPTGGRGLTRFAPAGAGARH